MAIQYRSDIDGLRAVAVLLVLLFHGGISLFSSGFVGVDVFFVISGYLITSIIKSSIDKNSFSFRDFYLKRLWRLQPVMLSVIVFTLVLSLVFYLPNDLINYIKSGQSTLLFTSNRFFDSITGGYSTPDSDLFLLLHTWSLSIEWQWYLILPITTLLIYKIKSSTIKKFIFFLLLTVSIIYCFKQSGKHPDKTYYFITSRIFEFLLGALIAFSAGKIKITPGWLTNIIGIVAFFAIIFIATMNDILYGYPNLYAIIVCIATALLIFVGQTKNTISSLFSVTPFVYIGKLSYSLYLWHWPVFSFFKYLSISNDYYGKILAYLITIILSLLSYYFIEKPLRKPKFSFIKSIALLLIIPISVFVLLNFIVTKFHGLPERINPEFAHAQYVIDSHFINDRDKCFSTLEYPDTECTSGSSDTKARTALLVGDSFANQMWGFMDFIGKNANISIVNNSKGACLALPGISLFDWNENKNKTYDGCTRFADYIYDKIKINHYNYVIISHNWQLYLNAKIINNPEDNISSKHSLIRYFNALEDAIKIIQDSGATPVIIKPVYWGNQYSCYRKNNIPLSEGKSTSCDEKYTTDAYKLINDGIDKLKEKYKNLIIINPTDIQCQNNICRASIDDIPIFKDNSHINDYGSYKIGTLYIERFGNPFLENN